MRTTSKQRETLTYSSLTSRLSGLGADKWAVYLKSLEMQRIGQEILSLAIGEPDMPADSKLVEMTVKSLRAGRTGYSYGRGEPEVLDAIARKYSTRTGRTVSAENIVQLPGTQTALFATMLTLAQRGDDVLVPDPYYATYEGIVSASGAKLVPVPLRPDASFELQPGDLKHAVTPNSRVLLLNNPHNPTGSNLGAEIVQSICKICADHHIWILADEVYEDLVFDGRMHSPLDIGDHAEHVVVVSSISKSHAAPGFRSGWAVGPGEFCRRLLALTETMMFGNAPFISDGTAAIVNTRSNVASDMRRSYASRAELVADVLAQQAEMIPVMPKSGMFMLLDVTATGLSGEQFAWQLLKTRNIAVMPGSSFGHQADRYIRLSLTTDDAVILAATKRILALYRSLVYR